MVETTIFPNNAWQLKDNKVICGKISSLPYWSDMALKKEGKYEQINGFLICFYQQ